MNTFDVYVRRLKMGGWREISCRKINVPPEKIDDAWLEVVLDEYRQLQAMEKAGAIMRSYGKALDLTGILKNPDNFVKVRIYVRESPESFKRKRERGL